MHINYDVNVDIGKLTNIFAKKEEKALELFSICHTNIA